MSAEMRSFWPGPRTAAFRVNTQSPEAQEAFEAGYAALLEFDYVTAAERFKRANAVDSASRARTIGSC